MAYMILGAFSFSLVSWTPLLDRTFNRESLSITMKPYLSPLIQPVSSPQEFLGHQARAPRFAVRGPRFAVRSISISLVLYCKPTCKDPDYKTVTLSLVSGKEPAGSVFLLGSV